MPVNVATPFPGFASLNPGYRLCVLACLDPPNRRAYAFFNNFAIARRRGHAVFRPGENAMSTKHFAAILLAGIAVVTCLGPSQAGNSPALAGAVTSAEEGPMGGVTVTATPDKSTISVTVTTDDQGRYSFPAGRLAPGAYALTIRAVGYDLDGKATANVAAEEPATADLTLKKTRNLVPQLASAEWLASWPGPTPRSASSPTA
jgi:hypothetical protein